jgi:hypothetical protein
VPRPCLPGFQLSNKKFAYISPFEFFNADSASFAHADKNVKSTHFIKRNLRPESVAVNRNRVEILRQKAEIRIQRQRNTMVLAQEETNRRQDIRREVQKKHDPFYRSLIKRKHALEDLHDNWAMSWEVIIKSCVIFQILARTIFYDREERKRLRAARIIQQFFRRIKERQAKRRHLFSKSVLRYWCLMHVKKVRKNLEFDRIEKAAEIIFWFFVELTSRNVQNVSKKIHRLHRRFLMLQRWHRLCQRRKKWRLLIITLQCDKIRDIMAFESCREKVIACRRDSSAGRLGALDHPVVQALCSVTGEESERDNVTLASHLLLAEARRKGQKSLPAELQFVDHADNLNVRREVEAPLILSVLRQLTRGVVLSSEYNTLSPKLTYAARSRLNSQQKNKITPLRIPSQVIRDLLNIAKQKCDQILTLKKRSNSLKG